jgi:uncharacterized protein (DUF2237 family)
MTLGFLDFSKSHGNDFSTPVPTGVPPRAVATLPAMAAQ